MTDTWMANGLDLAWLIDPYEENGISVLPYCSSACIKSFFPIHPNRFYQAK